jgi:hypothetical protein
LVPKNLKIKIYGTVILPVVLYTVPPDYKYLYFGIHFAKQGSGENFIMRSFMISTPHPILCE